MASWYSKWFGKWFSGWFYKTPAPPVPPQPPTPPAGTIQSRAPLDSPSILSGIRSGDIELDLKLSKDAPIECVEFEEGADVPTIAKLEPGCLPSTQPPPPPPYPYPRCQGIFPRKIRVVWGQSGSGKAVAAAPDKTATIYTGPGPWDNPVTYTSHATTVADSGDYSEPALEFTINDLVESMILTRLGHTLYSPWWGAAQPPLPGGTWGPLNPYPNVPTPRIPQFTALDLYTLDALKKGKVYNTTTTRTGYCILPSGLPGTIGPFQGPETSVSTIDYQEVTVGHVVALCLPVLDNEVNSLPILRLVFHLSRHVYTSNLSSPPEDVFPINGSIYTGMSPYGAAIQLVSGYGNYSINIASYPYDDGSYGGSVYSLKWPGCGATSVVVDVTRNQSTVSTQGIIRTPGDGIFGVAESFQFHLTW